jgi:hypothetical protein
MDKFTYVSIIFLLFSSLALSGQDIMTAEYFIDSDPGAGNGQTISFTSSSSVDFNFDVPTTGLSAGFHKVFVRFKDENEVWGLFAGQSFYVQPDVSLLTAATLEYAEFFIDDDPGVGNGTPIAINSGSELDFTFDAATSGLSSGFHKIFVRFRNNNQNWGLYSLRSFYIQPEIQVPTTPQIVEMEYYFDSYTAIGEANSVPVIPTEELDNTFDIDVSSLDVGEHTIYVRIRDDNNLWSYTNSQDITIEAATSNEGAEDAGLKIYPNPAVSILKIELGATYKALYYTLVNQQGQVLISQKVSEADRLIEIYVDHMPSGIYILNIVSHEKVISEKVTIK